MGVRLLYSVGKGFFMAKLFKGKLYVILSFAIVVFILVALFFFSGQNAEESAGVSGWIADFILRFFGLENPVIAGSFEHFIRKLAHFSLYAALGMGLFGLARYYFKRLRFPAVALASLVVAGLDEFHQLFVPGRAGMFRDVLLDLSGAVFGYLVCLTLVHIFISLRKKSCRRARFDMEVVERKADRSKNE